MQPDINSNEDVTSCRNIEAQLNKIKKFLSKEAKDPNDIQIVCSDHSEIKSISELIKLELNTKSKVKSFEKLFFIKTKIEQNKINYDKTFLLENFKRSRRNQNLIINLIKDGIAELKIPSAETILIIEAKEYFEKEWPYNCDAIVFPETMDIGMSPYNFLPYTIHASHIPPGPIIINLIKPEITVF